MKAVPEASAMRHGASAPDTSTATANPAQADADGDGIPDVYQAPDSR